MAAGQKKFAASNKDIARVLGLPASRRQLDEIDEWIHRPDFPKKSVNGFSVSDLLAWAEKVAPEFALKKTIAVALSADAKPLKKTDINLIQTLGLNSGSVNGDGAPVQYSDKVSGQAAIASLINHKYKVRCSRQDIQKWREAAPEPFPAPDARNDYNVAACFAWYEKWKLPKADESGISATQDLFRKAEEAKALAEVESLEHERWLRAVDRGKYIKRDVAKRTSIGALKKYHGFVRTQLERSEPNARREKLRALGISAEIVSAFYEFDLNLARATVDRIESWCEQSSNDVETGVSGEVSK